MDDQEIAVWRAGRAARVFGLISIGLATLGAGASFFYGSPGGGAALVAAIVVIFRSTLWPHVRATAEFLEVRNPLRTHVMLWREVLHIRPGYYGLEIETASGKTILAWSIQKSNLASALGWSVRADRICNEIALFTRRRNKGQPVRVDTLSEKSHQMSSARATLMIGGALLAIMIVIKILRQAW